MKKTKVFIIGALTLSLLFTGCSGSTGKNETTAMNQETEIVQETEGLAESKGDVTIDTSEITLDNIDEVFPVEYIPLPSGNLNLTECNITGIQGEIGYKVEITVETDLSSEIITNYYEDNFGSAENYNLETVGTNHWLITASSADGSAAIDIAPDSEGALVKLEFEK